MTTPHDGSDQVQPGGANQRGVFPGGDRDAGAPPAASVESAVIALLLAVPELAPAYLELADAADDDPGSAAAFSALADLVADTVADGAGHQDLLRRIADAVEATAVHAPDAEELVVWSFLDELPPDTLAALVPVLGPRTRSLASELVGPSARNGRPFS